MGGSFNEDDSGYTTDQLIYRLGYKLAGNEETAAQEFWQGLYPGINTESWTLQEDENAEYSGLVGCYPYWSVSGIIWSNTTLLDQNGSVFVEGSKPVNGFDIRSWLTGYMLGLAGKPLPIIGSGEPIAYLYNGVQLPKLPEWDKEKYPYAYISLSQIDIGIYELILTDSEKTVDNDGTIALSRAKGDVFTEYYCINGEWVLQDYSAIFATATWCSADLYYHNYSWMGELAGKLYLKASEPVPVYE